MSYWSKQRPLPKKLYYKTCSECVVLIINFYQVIKTNFSHFKENFRLFFKMTTLWSNQNTSLKILFYKTFFKLRENSCVSIWECKDHFGTSAQIQLSNQKMPKWSFKKWLFWCFSIMLQLTEVNGFVTPKWHGVICFWWEVPVQRWTELINGISGLLDSFLDLGWVKACRIGI